MVVLMVVVAAAWIMVTVVMAPLEHLELFGVQEDHSHLLIPEMFKR
jgi:hypothetical protein